jgi:hypothetical protein
VLGGRRGSARRAERQCSETVEEQCSETVEEQWLLDDLSQPDDTAVEEDAESPIHDVGDSAVELDVEVEVIHATEAAKSDAAPLGDLVPRGKVEVRILRELPDLVGELLAAATPAAVDLVAYLATHGHRASTARLRDSIGTQQVQASRAGKTVWSAAGAAGTRTGPPAHCLGQSALRAEHRGDL